MTLKIGRTRLDAHPLTLLYALAALMLGAREEAGALALGLTVHEASHLLAARALGVGVSGLRLMPFGGALQMENPYALPGGKLLLVAAAGPTANLLGVFAGAALAHWGLLGPDFALALARVNATLLLFNLIPALPLDGGRMLYALLYPRLGRERAVALGIWIGRGAAAMLLGLAACSAFALGRLNLSPVLAAVFMLASAPGERTALAGARLDTVLSELKPLTRPVPARVFAVSGACGAREALRVARPDALTLYAVYDGSRLASFTDDRRLLERILDGAGARIGDG